MCVHDYECLSVLKAYEYRLDLKLLMFLCNDIHNRPWTVHEQSMDKPVTPDAKQLHMVYSWLQPCVYITMDF